MGGTGTGTGTGRVEGRKGARKTSNTLRSLLTHPSRTSSERTKNELNDGPLSVCLLLVFAPSLSSRALWLIPSVECSSLHLVDA